METRRNTGDYRPTPSRIADQAHVVVVIDDLADLLSMGGQAISEPLIQLTQRGREARDRTVGIHVVAATSQPTPAVLGPLMKANAGTNHPFPVRLVGRVVSAEEARTASGWSGTGAERLAGCGDFLAVAEGRVLRFQAAHVSEDEVREVATYLAQAVSTTGETLPFAQQAAALPWPANRLTVVFKGA
jgi:S-DNA-T family DNA segregation ATPase FtsK/SpoIIIE